MKNKRAWFAGLLVGIVLMAASLVITLVFAVPLSNDPSRAIIGNGDFWYEYYFAKTSWMLLLGAGASAVSCVMLILRKK